MRHLRVPLALMGVAAAYLVTAAVLHLIWLAGGAEGWIVAFEFLTGTFLVGIAAVGATQAVVARALFERSDPLRHVWTLIVIGTIVRWLGHGVAYAARLAADGVPTGVPPPPLEQIGRMIAGPGFMLILAAALAIVVMRYRRLGLLARLTAVDWGLTGGVAFFALQSVRDILVWQQQADGGPSVIYAIGWVSDPLLAVLLIEAIVIRRAARAMQATFVARAWSALGAGILLTTIGDIGIWAAGHEFLSWQWASLFWYVWPMAETAFALAPAWQIAARHSPKPGLLPRRSNHVTSTRHRIPSPPAPVREVQMAEEDDMERILHVPPPIARDAPHEAPKRLSSVVSTRIH